MSGGNSPSLGVDAFGPAVISNPQSCLPELKAVFAFFSVTPVKGAKDEQNMLSLSTFSWWGHLSVMSEQWRRARCQQLWEEQQGLCFYCGAAMAAPMNQRLRHRKRQDAATIDHVVPQSQGGATEWPNEVAACRACNTAKADAAPTADDLHRLQALKI